MSLSPLCNLSLTPFYPFTFLFLFYLVLYLYFPSTVSAITGSDFGEEFILLPINGNHSESVFSDVSEGQYENETKMSTLNLCDCPPSNFIDRCRVMQEIYRLYVDNHRCVTVQGVRGTTCYYSPGSPAVLDALIDRWYCVILSTLSTLSTLLCSSFAILFLNII